MVHQEQNITGAGYAGCDRRTFLKASPGGKSQSFQEESFSYGARGDMMEMRKMMKTLQEGGSFRGGITSDGKVMKLLMKLLQLLLSFFQHSSGQSSGFSRQLSPGLRPADMSSAGYVTEQEEVSSGSDNTQGPATGMTQESQAEILPEETDSEGEEAFEDLEITDRDPTEIEAFSKAMGSVIPEYNMEKADQYDMMAQIELWMKNKTAENAEADMDDAATLEPVAAEVEEDLTGAANRDRPEDPERLAQVELNMLESRQAHDLISTRKPGFDRFKSMLNKIKFRAGQDLKRINNFKSWSWQKLKSMLPESWAKSNTAVYQELDPEILRQTIEHCNKG